MACPQFLQKGVDILKILSLDQAVAKTGWSLYRNNKLIKYGLIEQQLKKTQYSNKLSSIFFNIENLIKTLKPDVVVMEDVTYQRNAHVLIELANLQGCIIGLCLQHDIPFYIYHPSTWRKILSFDTHKKTRKQLKDIAVNFVSEFFSMSVQDDIAESICIGYAHILNMKGANQNVKKK